MPIKTPSGAIDQRASRRRAPPAAPRRPSTTETRAPSRNTTSRPTRATKTAARVSGPACFKPRREITSRAAAQQQAGEHHRERDRGAAEQQREYVEQLDLDAHEGEANQREVRERGGAQPGAVPRLRAAARRDDAGPAGTARSSTMSAMRASAAAIRRRRRAGRGERARRSRRDCRRWRESMSNGMSRNSLRAIALRHQRVHEPRVLREGGRRRPQRRRRPRGAHSISKPY